MTSHEEPSVYYSSIEEQFLARDGVELRRALHRPALAYRGKIFAFTWQDALVVKLGETETEVAVLAGHGFVLQMGASRRMKAWLEVPFDTDDAHRWAHYVERAYEHTMSMSAER